MRFYLKLDKSEFEALKRCARHQHRDPRDHAAYLIRQELVRRGYLPRYPTTPDSTPTEPEHVPAQ